MILRIISHIVLILAIGMLQVSFLSTWPAPVNSLNLMLCAVLFSAIMVEYRTGLIWAAGGGFFLELYSGYPFGFTFAAMILTVMSINFLFQNFFTNRSLYTLVLLAGVGTAVYSTLLLLFNLLTAVFGISVSTLTFDYKMLYFWQPFFNIIIVAVIFFSYQHTANRLRNIFVLSSDYYEKYKK